METVVEKKRLGRPKGSKNSVKKERRKQRQMRAFDDEWKMINLFSHYLKRRDLTKLEESYATIVEYIENYRVGRI